ncbi:hypothetical protein BG005_005440 [Podila minutissima]|nr:hypothetical protein BG005_005440 [Podila minutissima]
MTRAANSRKGTGNSSSTRAAPVFRGRDVVFVDPLDETMGYWWPAMIVPVPEIDSSMEIPSLNPGECLVKYFEDNTYSVVPMTDLQPFVPTTIPFLEYELAAGQKFLKNGGVVNALAYLETGKVKRKFSWHRFGTAQGQDLSLDMNKTKLITLPVVSDASFAAQGLKGNATTSSASSSPTISTANYTDTEDSKDEEDNKKVNHLPSGLNTNGLRGSGPRSSTPSSSTSVSSSGALLPSQSGAKSIETMDEEFNGRSKVKSEVTATKDSPARSRSRRGSRDSETKVTTTSGTTTSDVGETDSTKKGSSRRSRTTSEQPSPTIQKNKRSASTTTIDTSNTELASTPSRQGSVEPSQASSPRSTRHSFRSTKASDGQAEDSTDTNASEEVTKPQPPRMTRTRSVPKTVRSLKSDEDSKADLPQDQGDSEAPRSQLSSVPSLTQSSPSTTVSVISSPSSITEEELPGLSGASSSSSSASLSPTFEQERRELNFNFEHVFPTLAIGSKEREAFYETCMDHLQKLRREHRRLKQIVQSSEPKSRRGTRSSPSRHLHYNQRGNSPYSSSSSSSYYPSRSGASGPGGSSANAPSPPSSSNQPSSISSANGTNTNSSGSTGLGCNTGVSGTTTARRSAATAAAAAVAATVSRSSRQSNNSQSSVTHEVQSKKRSGANGESSREVQTRAKRRLR